VQGLTRVAIVFERTATTLGARDERRFLFASGGDGHQSVDAYTRRAFVLVGGEGKDWGGGDTWSS
jgi:hypothetical protein